MGLPQVPHSGTHLELAGQPLGPSEPPADFRLTRTAETVKLSSKLFLLSADDTMHALASTAFMRMLRQEDLARVTVKPWPSAARPTDTGARSATCWSTAPTLAWSRSGSEWLGTSGATPKSFHQIVASSTPTWKRRPRPSSAGCGLMKSRCRRGTGERPPAGTCAKCIYLAQTIFHRDSAADAACNGIQSCALVSENNTPPLAMFSGKILNSIWRTIIFAQSYSFLNFDDK